MRHADTNSTDQTIAFWAFDSDGAAVTGLTTASDGLVVKVRVDANGREGTETTLTLTTRDSAGVHKDSAFTEIGSGKYEVDIADSFLTTANVIISLDVVATDITGHTVIDRLEVSIPNVNIKSTSISASAITTGINSGTITQHRGDRWSFSITGLGSLASRENIWFTIKSSAIHTDSEALVQIDEDNGLVYIDSASGTALNGSLTVTDESAGDIAIVLQAEETAKLPIETTGVYDVQIKLTANDTVSTLSSGVAVINADVTRAT